MRGRAKYTSEREAKAVADKYVEDPKKPKKRVVKRRRKADTAHPVDDDYDTDSATEAPREPETVEELLEQRRRERKQRELEEFLERERQEKMPLTDKQRLFAHEYIIDQNQTQAAIRAGYAVKAASVSGHELIRKPNVLKLIKELQEQREKRLNFDADRVLGMLVGQVTADVADLYDEDGHIRPVSEWPMPFRQGLVKEVTSRYEYEMIDGKKEAVGRITSVKIHDRKQQMVLIGRHIGIQAFADPRTSQGQQQQVEKPLDELKQEIVGTGLRIRQNDTTEQVEPKIIEGTAKAQAAPGRGLKIKD